MNRGGALRGCLPIPEEIYGFGPDPHNEITPEFMDTMLKMSPILQSKDASKITMRELSNAAGMNVQNFYQMIIANIYKTPRPLARKIMLSKAIDLLRDTEMDIETIAKTCGFVSPNYFIAMFYHQMKNTPEQYRKKHGQKKVDDV